MFLIVILISFCVLSCTESDVIQTNVRASLKSNGSGTIRASVVVEGQDGNSLSGAVVFIKDNHNSYLQLNYEPSTLSYTGLLEEYPGETKYTVEVASILSNDIIKLKVPYSKIEKTPNVLVFQDSAGNSVLSGQSLLSNRPIQIGWVDCGKDVLYQITLGTVLTNYYMVSTKACTVTIPAGTVPAGSYLLEIMAQKINGDILFRKYAYYSYSFNKASLVSCNVN